MFFLKFQRSSFARLHWYRYPRGSLLEPIVMATFQLKIHVPFKGYAKTAESLRSVGSCYAFWD